MQCIGGFALKEQGDEHEDDPRPPRTPQWRAVILFALGAAARLVRAVIAVQLFVAELSPVQAHTVLATELRLRIADLPCGVMG